MFERRPILGLILALNVCVLIWRISVQEPSMLEAESVSGAGSSSSSSSSSTDSNSGAGGGVGGAGASLHLLQWNDRAGWYNAAPQLQPQSQLYAGKHLLSERLQLATNETSESTARQKYYKYQIASTSIKRAAVESSGSGAAIGDVSSGSGGGVNSLNSVSISGNTKNIKTKIKHTKMQSLNSRKRTTATATATAAVDVAVSSSPASLVTATTAQRPGNGITADVVQLIDLHDFEYIMTQRSCSAGTAALILVHSAPRNIEKRSLIRETWGSVAMAATASALRVIFLLGAVVDPVLQQQLAHENARHGDLVQGSFVDDYRNMTYKHVMAFKWFLYNCAHAQILIKVDDDVYVNTPKLLQYLPRSAIERHFPPVPQSTILVASPPASPPPPSLPLSRQNPNSTLTTVTVETAAAIVAHHDNAARFNASQSLFRHPQNLLFCQEYVGSLVKRSYRSKWRVSFKEYAGRYYPPYCPGYAIIYSADVVQRLYKAAQRQKYFWIDDVHITGVLAQQTNTSITTSLRYVLFGQICERLLDGKTNLSETEFLFAWHLISPEQIRALWRLYSEPTAASSPPSSSLHAPSSALASTLLSSDRGLDSYSYASYPLEEEGFR